MILVFAVAWQSQNLNLNTKIFFQENAFQNVICKMLHVFNLSVLTLQQMQSQSKRSTHFNDPYFTEHHIHNKFNCTITAIQSGVNFSAVNYNNSIVVKMDFPMAPGNRSDHQPITIATPAFVVQWLWPFREGWGVTEMMLWLITQIRQWLYKQKLSNLTTYFCIKHTTENAFLLTNTSSNIG